jgi:hypothetical protein
MAVPCISDAAWRPSGLRSSNSRAHPEAPAKHASWSFFQELAEHPLWHTRHGGAGSQKAPTATGIIPRAQSSYFSLSAIDRFRSPMAVSQAETSWAERRRRAARCRDAGPRRLTC